MSFKFDLFGVTFMISLISSLSQCPYNKDFGVTPRDVKEILALHNEIRFKILRGEVPGQPRGVGLNTLVWDSRLAAEAQKIANKCVFKRSPVDDKRFSVGQNLHMSLRKTLPFGSDWKSVIDNWYQEHKKYKYGTPSADTALRYTQLVWANTKYLGCGYTTFRKTNNIQKLYVCNYGPAGNVPYERAQRGI